MGVENYTFVSRTSHESIPTFQRLEGVVDDRDKVVRDGFALRMAGKRQFARCFPIVRKKNSPNVFVTGLPILTGEVNRLGIL